MRILMVCLGNICRSPIAEGVLQHKADKAGLNWEVASAGTESYHIGSAPHIHSQDICWQHGLDISNQVAAKFKKEDFNKYDKIYALASDVYNEIKHIGGAGADMSKVDLLLNELHPGKNQSVTDPYYGGAEGYADVYNIIEQACDAIINKYN